jgi:outer membrane protein OmpA-like peptidoglycan-associated protein
VSISRNGSHIKAYINQDKVIDLPNALPPNENYAFLLCSNFNGAGFYVSNVRMATGVPQPAKDLKEKKLYITQNIRFATNSDKIAANSYPTLSQVAQAIKSLEGKIQIVGHTDSDGNADKNLELSQKRAAAVKNALVKEFGIDAARLETDGKGQSKPIDSNDTPQGKANNRRVEFVVLP